MAVLNRAGRGDGAVTLVTGGSRGIGHEVARQLADRGFRVVVTSRKRRDAEAAAKRIGASAIGHEFEASDRDSIRELDIPIGDRSLKVTISIGVAALPDVAPDGGPNEILALADARLYKAKDDGKDRVCAEGAD